LEVVQYIKDTYHDGKCEVASIGKFTSIFGCSKGHCCVLYVYT